jgi:hypothetical protein
MTNNDLNVVLKASYLGGYDEASIARGEWTLYDPSLLDGPVDGRAPPDPTLR